MRNVRQLEDGFRGMVKNMNTRSDERTNNGKSPGKARIDELPAAVKENLSSGEEVICYLKTFELVERPDYIILTSLRVVYFDERHIGRYVFKSIPFQKILEIKAQRGAVLWGEISFKSEDGTMIELKKVDHHELENFLDTLETAYNKIAVEPISIKHEKDLLGKATWEFNKPEEVIFRQQPLDLPTPSEDPINQLKMRFIRGEISEEEYKAKLRVLLENK